MSSEPKAGSAGDAPLDVTPNVEPPVELDSVELRYTGLPILRTWRALYTFVLVAFLLMVILLTAFTQAYSRAKP